jgi:hypothetical protein
MSKPALTTDAILSALLADAAARPADPLPLAVLADYLSEPERSPGPVRQGHCPDWLRHAWLKARRAEPSDPQGPRGGWRGLAAGWAVLMDMDEWLSGQRPSHYWRLDHHGSTVVGGLPCFASEPYATLETAREQAKLLAGKAGCVGVGLGEGHWARGTVRVLLLPVAGTDPNAPR